MVHTFAVLGATGKTGREIVKQLLAKDSYPVHLQIYIHSQTKLLGLLPSLSSDARVNVFEGSLTDTDLMTRCLSGAQTITCSIGENENISGLRVMRDAALSM